MLNKKNLTNPKWRRINRISTARIAKILRRKGCLDKAYQVINNYYVSELLFIKNPLKQLKERRQILDKFGYIPEPMDQEEAALYANGIE